MKGNTEKKGLACLLAVLIILALIFMAAAGAIWYISHKLNLIQYDDGSREIDTSTSYEVNNDELQLGDLPDAPESMPSSAVEKIDLLENENVLNILLLGTDERTSQFSDNARADSIMVLSLNTELHTIKLISIERGIGVPVPGRNDDWITHTFRYGGAKLTMDTVKELFKLDLDRYVRVNFHVFEDAINAIGGVDINLTQAEADYLNYYLQWSSGKVKVVKEGTNCLDGYAALQYARIRKIDSDWKRIERQRTVIQAALNRVKNLELSQLNELANTILPMVQTNLTKGEITSLMLEIPGFISSGAQINDMTIPVDGTCWNSVGVDGRRMIGVDFERNARILRDFFYSVPEEETDLS